eukprot:scaffold16314_cov62-Phaeocystis_antarctica.AAC.5
MQAGGGQPPRRVPAAVAASARGLQLPSRRRSPIRGRQRGVVDKTAHGQPGLHEQERAQRPRVLPERGGDVISFDHQV